MGDYIVAEVVKEEKVMRDPELEDAIHFFKMNDLWIYVQLLEEFIETVNMESAPIKISIPSIVIWKTFDSVLLELHRIRLINRYLTPKLRPIDGYVRNVRITFKKFSRCFVEGTEITFLLNYTPVSNKAQN